MRTLLLVLVLGGCNAEIEDACDDGADNDGDGLFDCDDDDCSKDCGIDIEPAGTGVVGTGVPTGDDTPTFYPPSISVAVDWNDDGAYPIDTDGDGLPDINCDDVLDIEVFDPMGETDWRFGMAETGSPNGWYGEDCYSGQYGYDLCHPIGPVHNLFEVADCTLQSVVPGSTTLFDAAKDPFLTYFLEDSQGVCFVFGHDTTYYAPLGCFEMM